MPMSPRLLRPRQTGFDPRSISGLALWLDAADSTTITLNGSTVSEWRDKSHGSRHFAQSVSVSQPVYTAAGQNGRNCITFDGSRSLSSSLASSEWSFLHDGSSLYDIYVVCRTASGSTQLRSIMATGNSSRSVRSFFLWHDHRTGFNNSVYAEITTVGAGSAGFVAAETISNLPAGVMRRIRISGDPANATVANRLVGQVGTRNGTSDTAATGTASSGPPTFTLQIGSIGIGGLLFSGDMCEIVIFRRDTNLTAPERSSLESYLDRKWAL